MFPEPTEWHLIGCLIELISIPKSKSNTSTPKTNSLTFLTKGSFTRDEWNHSFCLFNINHVSSTVCFAALTKRFQQDSGEERVTKRMMNLIARTPAVVSSSTSLSLGKRYHGKQDPWTSVVADDRSGQPDKLSSTDVLNLIMDRASFSQKWKSGVTAYARSGQPDKISWSTVQQVCPHHGETLLDGAAQSVKYGGIIRDR